MLYTLTERDNKDIYAEAVIKFNSKSGKSHQTFLTQCVIDSFLSFLISKNCVVKNGKIYVSQEEN
jgi:hypothetical protein